MKLDIKDLKNLVSKLNLAIEKSKVNPKSGWIELEADNESVNFKVSNYDYYLEVSVLANEFISDEDKFHVTILADTFIPLVSKLDVNEVNVYEKLNSLIVETDNSSYTFPVIKELGKTKCLDVIDFNLKAVNLSNKEIVNFDGFSKVDFCENEYFGMQKFNIETEWADCSNEEKFFILTCVDGCGIIESCGTVESDGTCRQVGEVVDSDRTNGQSAKAVSKQEFCEQIKMGDSYLIPATLGKYVVKGNLAVIKSYPM